MDYGFKFSVIMPIYNTEEYLEEAIESIVNQDIGFLENVKLILIDDGSKDNSYEICQRYKDKFPNNIVALSKENGGQGSARNLGLEHVDSEYITFLDSDDKLSLNALSVVYDFFSDHEGEIDIVSIPLVFFDAREGDHILNYKFKTERIVDLEKSPKYPQLAINSSFIKSEAFKDYRFNTNLVTGEDAIIVNKILLEKKKIAFLNRAKYFYRKRQDESSTVDNAKSKKEFFISRLRDYFKVLIDYSIEKEGFVPDFIQYIIAYDIQWYYNISDFPDFMSKDEIKEFWNYFYDVLSFIDDNVITDKVIIKKVYVRSFLMYIKNHKDFYIELFNGSDDNLNSNLEESNLDIDSNTDFDEDNSEPCSTSDIYLKTADFTINHLNNHIIYFDNITILDGFLYLNGSFTSSCDYNTLNIEAIRTYEDGSREIFSGENDFEKTQVKRILGIDWHYRYHFKFKIALDEEEESRIRFNLVYEEDSNKLVLKNHLRFNKDALIFENISYFVKDSHIFLVRDDSFIITQFSYEKYFKLKEELNSQITDLIKDKKRLTRENKALIRKNESLEKKNSQLQNKNQKLKNKNQKLKEDLSKSRAKNKEILNSTSWKVTEPLRKSKHLLDKGQDK